MNELSINLKIKDIIEKYPDLCELKTFEKGKTILTPGSVANNVYYIFDGIAKVYLENDDLLKYSTIVFFFKDDIVFPYKSFFENVPSIIGIEVIRKSKMCVISKPNLEKIKKQEPELNELILKITIETMYKFIYYIYDFSCYETKDRYKFALERMPLIKELTDEEVAEYLGTNRVTINRIRNIK